MQDNYYRLVLDYEVESNRIISNIVEMGLYMTRTQLF